MNGDARTGENSARFSFPRPIYLVVCPVSSDIDDDYEPISHEFTPGTDDPATTFDSELVPILPAIWYALHLPSTRTDAVDIPVMVGIREQLREKRRHLILPVSASALQHPLMLAALTQHGEPMLIISADDGFEAATAASRDGRFVLPPVRVSDLNKGSLRQHWQMISDRWSADWPEGVELDPMPPSWSPTIASNGSAVPLRRLLKSIGRLDATVRTHDQEPYAGAVDLLQWRAYLDALSGMEERGLSMAEAELVADTAVSEAGRRLKVPLTLGLPGVAPRYRRLVGRLAQEATATSPDEQPQAQSNPTSTEPGDPPDVLRLMVAHNAAGDNSVGIVSADPVPDAAFVALADLERYWVDSTRTRTGIKPATEARLRARLDEAMRPFWSDRMISVIRTASQIDAFTNFPIGLLRLPEHTAPLAALVPIAYHPINPLTRAFQLEFTPDHSVDFSNGMRVLVIECIPDTDPVGVISRGAWTFASQELTDPTRAVYVDIVEVSDKAGVADALATNRPDVLILSAHGVYDADANMAGLAIGDEVSLGDDLGPMPPVVLLSSCHSGPRGAGPVAVADLLLRAGARAVLSTLVPVGVLHNSTFMTRLLVYMSESIGGSETHKTLLDLWHRVQTNTVIMDILYGNPRLLEWGHSDSKGTPPIVEFMSGRSAGRLRPWHLYQDAEAVLLDIAAERGEKEAVQGWLRAPGYVPESMMYTIVGDPSSVRFQASQLTSAQRQGTGAEH
ncbi:CHAT domain protein [Microbacterium oxydans]|uniref:CHAT domain protein n=1 Tax=Microbacterium oxydans TaxID=82380 RepID=A0A0F0KSL9_9MICO|nr:CHAT domain-containing protein [Microbacterium oxydans]KJL23479.1 CHAT domain protein [Microbacterium oxydans]